MTRPETLRYSAPDIAEDRRQARAAQDAARPLGPLRPDGRWAALLRALEAGPMTPSALVRAVDDGRFQRWRLRQKVLRALHDMARLDLVAAAHAGWTRTAEGEAALQSLLPATPQKDADR